MLSSHDFVYWKKGEDLRVLKTLQFLQSPWVIDMTFTYLRCIYGSSIPWEEMEEESG